MVVEKLKIIINGVDYSKTLSSFYFYNSLEYATKPERVVDGTLENDGVDSYYIPKVEFTLSILTPSQYSTLVQALNSKGFILECYDYELMARVRRFMCMAKIDRNKLIMSGGDIKQLIDTKLSMESKFSYLDYIDLAQKAILDTRF